MCHTAHMTSVDEMRGAFGFVTGNAARALRLADYALEPGCRADVNVLAAPTIQHMLRLQQPPAWVIKDGQVLARNDLTRELVGS